MDDYRKSCVLSGRGRADHSSRGDLPSVVCLSVIEEPRTEGLEALGLSNHVKKITYLKCQLVETLSHKPEGRGFDSPWCHWIFSLT